MSPLTGHTADCPLLYSAAGGDPLYTVLHTLYTCTQVYIGRNVTERVQIRKYVNCILQYKMIYYSCRKREGQGEIF